MISSYVFSYHGKKIKAIHRNLSSMVNLTDALISVGFKTNNVVFQNNGDLETNRPDAERPRSKVLDWYYFSATNGSLLEDSTQIVF